MKIKNIEISKEKIELKTPVRVSFGVIAFTKNVFVTITLDDGTKGIGEISNLEYITHVSDEVIYKELIEYKEKLIGRDIESFAEIIQELNLLVSMPTLAGLDMAILDAYSTFKRIPLYKVLSNDYSDKSTNYTLGIMPADETLQKVNQLISSGKTNVKVKVGKNIDDDIFVLNHLFENTNINFRVDANQGYSYDDLVRFIKELDMNRIILIEEPFKAGEYDMLKKAQEEFPDIFFLADETISTVNDAKELAKRKAVKGFNIKLVKCGGLMNAMKINKIAKEAGIQCMLGCMAETKLALSAAAHLVVSDENITSCDLDAYYLFKNPNIIETDVVLGDTKISIPKTIVGIGIKKELSH